MPLPTRDFLASELLKRDLLGTVEAGTLGAGEGVRIAAVRRDVGRTPFLLRAVARRLLAREARALQTLADLDRQYPGIRFRMIDEQERIRRHIRIFVNGEQVRALSHPLRESDEVVIVQALSGG